MRRRSAALGLLAALTLGACTPSASSNPTVTPAPSPTFTCTAPAIQGPCTAEKAAEEKKQAADVAAAKVSYNSFFSEYNRLGRAGGTDRATATMSRYAAGPFLAAYVSFSKNLKDAKGHTSGSITNRYLTYQPAEHRTDAPQTEMTFMFCLDATHNKVYDSAGKLAGTGQLAAGKVYFRQIDGTWKMWDTQDKAVDECPRD